MPTPESTSPHGRGTPLTPPNRFLPAHAESDYEHFEDDEEFIEGLRNLPTEFLPDRSQSAVTSNDSPDISFRYSLNPYRGCEHGCAYCYARPTHEYLGLNAGVDFESKIFVKERAPELFRGFLARDSWLPEVIVMSGVTDCYQPAERQYRLTRGCLEVALDARQPMAIVTKNALVLRDLDVLCRLAELRLIHVAISVTTLDGALARSMEPRTSRPRARLRAIRELSAAGVPVRALIAPIIPGLNDHEIPALLAAAKEAGAHAAGYTLLRLPLAVAPVFRDWLARVQPTHAARVEALIRATRAGKISSSRFGERMRGTGTVAEQVTQAFRVFARKHGLDQPLPPLDHSQFRPPAVPAGQLRLF
ncbi:MAG: PA0069 family radical SAM protein [Planctomycetaceae bacterium]